MPRRRCGRRIHCAVAAERWRNARLGNLGRLIGASSFLGFLVVFGRVLGHRVWRVDLTPLVVYWALAMAVWGSSPALGPSRRDHGAQTACEGTGLGLAVAQGIVAAHGGTIRVVSACGRGSELSIVLPLGRDAAGSAAAGAT